MAQETLAQEMVLALRSKTHTTHTHTTPSHTSTNKTSHATHHHSGGSAIWFGILAIVALVVLFFGVRFFRGRAHGVA
jgi:hypothetical protein